jgi:SpoVK/Ycf46/Vps4 family AAA+-type ATPase
MTGTMLSWMQDREADGVVLIGPAGTAKSAVAKAAGTAAGIPTIAFDF